MWCPTQRLLPLSRQYSNSLLGLHLQRCATLCRETLNSGPRQALLNTHSPPGQWGVGWMSPHKSRWPGLPSLRHHTYTPQVTGGLLGIGISALSCPLSPEPARLLWENTAQDAEMMQILDCWFTQIFFVVVVEFELSKISEKELKNWKSKGKSITSVSEAYRFIVCM